MRLLRSLFVAGSLVLVTAALSAACTVESAFVSGKLENGSFVIVSALDSQGNALEGLSGKTFSKIETAENVVMPAASTDELVYLVADLDFDAGVLRVASSTGCAATAHASVASAKSASGAGAGCCAAKAAGVKAASVSNVSSSCGAAAKSAGAGCHGAKAASASYANANSGCGAKAETAYTMVVFNVSGMTCEGCASKIRAAVAALEMEGVEGVEVDVAGGKATVRASGKVCTDTLKSAITGAGFPAEIAQGEAPEGEAAKS